VPDVLAWYGIQDGDNGEYKGSPDARSWAEWHDDAPKQGV
jgi:phenol hydroxylase P3 protein